MSRKRMVMLLSAAGVALLLAPPVASAQNRFHGLDRNRDGVITRAEWPANDTSFGRHDRNRDGVIGTSEIRHVPAWDARNKRWERTTGTAGKSHDDHGKVKAKPSKPVKPAKPAKPAKPKGGRGNG